VQLQYILFSHIYFLNKIFSVFFSYKMAKSEINLLQELSIKQGFIPIYDFTEKRISGISIQFTCYVSCKELRVHGTGNTKKEAKHNAARNMLSLLATNNKISLPVDTLASDTATSSVANTLQSPVKICEKTAEHNYVGLLQVSFMSHLSNITVKIVKIIQFLRRSSANNKK